jgi:hypothetical protein
MRRAMQHNTNNATIISVTESLTAERKQVQKINNMSFRQFSVTEEYQNGENSYCEFFGLVPFLQLAIQQRLLVTIWKCTL